jgi:hypothetical protein
MNPSTSPLGLALIGAGLICLGLAVRAWTGQ